MNTPSDKKIFGLVFSIALFGSLAFTGFSLTQMKLIVSESSFTQSYLLRKKTYEFAKIESMRMGFVIIPVGGFQKKHFLSITYEGKKKKNFSIKEL